MAKLPNMANPFSNTFTFFQLQMFLNDSEVKVVGKENYIGVFLSDDCSDDVTRQLRSMLARGNAH